MAGTPDWVDNRRGLSDRWNNHNWVEVWDGRWHFTGACEYDPRGFNRTWFFPQPVKAQIPGSRMHAIYAVSYKPTANGRLYPLVWVDDSSDGVNAEDVTRYYLDAKVLSADV